MSGTILVVDDDPVFLGKTKQFLEANGFQVIEASSWETFMKAFYTGPATPDVVLFDINLGPGISGDKMLLVFKEARKRLSVAQKAKLVLFSSVPESELKTRAELCGADGYISKDLLTGKSGTGVLLQLKLFLL